MTTSGRVHLHFDCPSGIAGDMFLGACLDAGMPWSVLEDMVSRLGLEGVSVSHRRAVRGGLAGVRFSVLKDGEPVEGPDPEEEEGEGHSHPPTHSGHRSPGEIADLLRASSLEPGVRDRTIGLFSRLAEAEARVHGVALDEVHFHEVGAVDAIVDLAGAATALEWFGAGSVSCGAINVGGGEAATEHGRLPVPAPATAELLKGLPIYGAGELELVTPTGAVILVEAVDEFGAMPTIEVEEIGYGLGRREVPGRPNAFRLLRGRSRSAPASDSVMVVECEIDDLSGEGFGYLVERLLEGPALDVYLTPVQMKKSRPGSLVSVLCRAGDLESVASCLLAESGSLGCRYHEVGRFEAERTSHLVTTPFGEVRVKEGRFRGRRISLAPEYEDCRRLARKEKAAWREVHQAALRAFDEVERG